MDKFERGYKEAVGGIVLGIVIGVFTRSGLLPQSTILLVGLINALVISVLVFSMPSWGVPYTLGWLFGLLIFLESGLLGLFELILYIFLPFIILVVRGILWILGGKSTHTLA